MITALIKCKVHSVWLTLEPIACESVHQFFVFDLILVHFLKHGVLSTVEPAKLKQTKIH